MGNFDILVILYDIIYLRLGNSFLIVSTHSLSTYRILSYGPSLRHSFLCPLSLFRHSPFFFFALSSFFSTFFFLLISSFSVLLLFSATETSQPKYLTSTYLIAYSFHSFYHSS